MLAVVTVNTLDDSIDFNDNLLSLREAIFATNTVPGADTIEFAPALTANGPATILLTQGELAITDALSIAGPGAELLTIDASGSDPSPAVGNGVRIFNIDDQLQTAIDVSIRGMTLTGGDAASGGGAMLSREQLTVSHLVFSGNRSSIGGALVLFGASTTIADSSFVDNSASIDGGAIAINSLFDGAVVTIVGNHIADNSAGRGGAIAVRGAGVNSGLIVDRTTIANNSALSQGGGIALVTSNLGARTTISSSTISGNSAASQGGGVFATSARDLAIVDSVISDNFMGAGQRGGGQGGGLHLTYSDVSITGSTISGNEASIGGGIFSRASELSISFSSIANNTANTARGGGVYSQQDRLSLLGSTITGNSANGTNFRGGGGGIWHSPGPSFPTVLSDNIIDGNTALGDGGGLYIDLSVSSGSVNSLTLNNLTVTGNSAANGGGIAVGKPATGPVGPSLVLNGGAVSENTATGSGGGIYSVLPALTINGTTVSDNRANLNGGGIAIPQLSSTPAQVLIVDARLNGNVAGAGDGGLAAGDGGALWLTSNASSINIINSTMSSNIARNGGSIFRRANVPSGPLSIIGSTISGNTARGAGGGVYNQNGFLAVQGATISKNHSLGQNVGNGGGILNRMGDIAISTSSLTGNTAANGRGGALYHNFGDLTITSSTIAGNSARTDGGGVLALTNSQPDRIVIHASTVSGNSSDRTGGMYLRGDTTIRHSTIVGNTGGINGAGGVLAGDGSARFELDHAIVAGNFVETSGPPLHLDIRFFLNMSNVTLRHSLIGDSAGTQLIEAPLGSPDVHGNLIGRSAFAEGSGAIDPRVGPLANNGGPTFTRALLPDSPALDGGALVTNAPLGYDQRGNPFSRMVDGTGDGIVRIDVGAYESQGVPHFSPGDYNRDGIVDACDYLVWRETLGAKTIPFEGADGDGNGLIDSGDYSLWKANFGKGLVFETAPTSGFAASLSVIDDSSTAIAHGDAATELAQEIPALPGVNRAISRPRVAVRTRAEFAARDTLLAWWSTRPRSDSGRSIEVGSNGDDSTDSVEESTTRELDLAFAALGA